MTYNTVEGQSPLIRNRRASNPQCERITVTVPTAIVHKARENAANKKWSFSYYVGECLKAQNVRGRGDAHGAQ